MTLPPTIRLGLRSAEPPDGRRSAASVLAAGDRPGRRRSTVAASPCPAGARLPRSWRVPPVDVAGPCAGNGDGTPGVAGALRGDLVGVHLVATSYAGATTAGTGRDVGWRAAGCSPDRSTAGCPGGVGLTTALVRARRGYVVVGPAGTHGAGAARPSGCLIVLECHGRPRRTCAAAASTGRDMTRWVSGRCRAVLSERAERHGGRRRERGRPGTVRRLASSTPGSAPGLLFVDRRSRPVSRRCSTRAPSCSVRPVSRSDANGTLYVADTVQSRIVVVPFATFRSSPARWRSHLGVGGGPRSLLGLASGSNGDLRPVNGNDGNAVEVTPFGARPRHDRRPVRLGGGLFGLAVAPDGRGVLFVDDDGSADTLGLLR